MTALTAQLKQARGWRYGELLHGVWNECIGKLADDYNTLLAHHGRMTTYFLCQLAVKYDLSFKQCCLFLEEATALPTGTYDRVKGSGIIQQGMDAAQRDMET